MRLECGPRSIDAFVGSGFTSGNDPMLARRRGTYSVSALKRRPRETWPRSPEILIVVFPSAGRELQLIAPHETLPIVGGSVVSMPPTPAATVGALTDVTGINPPSE